MLEQMMSISNLPDRESKAECCYVHVVLYEGGTSACSLAPLHHNFSARPGWAGTSCLGGHGLSTAFPGAASVRIHEACGRFEFLVHQNNAILQGS